MWAVVEAMAAGETCFFREPAAFARFRDEILPSLASTRQGSGPIRVWSAGCASGQEAYSLAFQVEEANAAVLACGVDILASDLSDRQLEKAQSGLYTQFEVQRGLPDQAAGPTLREAGRAVGRCRRACARWCAGAG